VCSACCWPPLLTSVRAQCELLNDDVDAIVRRARSKLSMSWRYAEPQATVLLNDGFAVLDRERPDVDTKLGGNGSDWYDVSGDASANVTRFRLSRASPATAGTLRLVFAIDSTPGSTKARSVASTARGRHAVSAVGRAVPRWRVSSRPSGASPSRPD
jgi:hypothetical protein